MDIVMWSQNSYPTNNESIHQYIAIVPDHNHSKYINTMQKQCLKPRKWEDLVFCPFMVPVLGTVDCGLFVSAQSADRH